MTASMFILTGPLIIARLYLFFKGQSLYIGSYFEKNTIYGHLEYYHHVESPNLEWQLVQ